MQVLSDDIKRGNFKLKKVAKQASAYAYGDVKAELKAGKFKLKKASKISPTSAICIDPFAADAVSNDAQFTMQPMTNAEAHQIFVMFDADGSGTIDIDELVVFVKAIKGQDDINPAAVSEVWDNDDSGEVTALAAVAVWAGLY